MLPAPPLYPDELLSGALARCCRWFGIKMRVLLRDVLLTAPDNDRFLGVGPLAEAAALFQTTPENLLWEHTTFPYATAFIGRDDCDRAERDILAPSAGRRHPGITRLSRVGQRRVCKQCLQDDLALYGESFWRRSHNLPGAFYCVRHGSPLHRTSLAAHESTLTILPAECELVPPSPAWDAPGSLSLAEASTRILNRSPEATEKRTGEFYLELAVQLGWLTDRRRVNEGAFLQVFLNCFHKEFLHAASVEFGTTRPWPALAVKPSSYRFSPLRQLMVETALKHGTPHDGFLDHRAKGPPQPDSREMDSKFAAAGLAELEKVKAAGKKLTVVPFLRLIGAKSAWDLRKDDYPKLADVIKGLQAWNDLRPIAAQGLTWEQTDARFSEAAEAELEKCMEKCEAVTVRAFLQRVGAWNAWVRFDSNLPKLALVVERLKTWSESVRAGSRRSIRRIEDERYAAAAEAELRRAMGAGERLTLGAVMKRVGAATLWTHYSNDCPKLRAVAERIREREKKTRA